MDIENKLASFYREVSEKCEKDGDIEKALENLLKARAADDGHEAFYAEEEERLRGLLRSFDAELFRELAALYRKKAVQTEDFVLYDRADEYAGDLAERVGRGEADALRTLEELRRLRDAAPSGKGTETPVEEPSIPDVNPMDKTVRIWAEPPADKGKSPVLGETDAGAAEPVQDAAETFAYDDVAKILSDYYDQNKDFEDDDGAVTWIDLLASLFDPEMLAPYIEDMRSGVLSGFADSVCKTLNERGPNYQNTLKALLEICQEYPCGQDDPEELAWYYHKSLDYLEQARTVGAVNDRLYNKIKRGIEAYPPEAIMKIDEEAAQRAAYREKGLCLYCGGSFERGLFFQKCSACGRRKNY